MILGLVIIYYLQFTIYYLQFTISCYSCSVRTSQFIMRSTCSIGL